jgi:prepilin-type N-terminal cleavage/methylation domain-containing protein
MKFFKQSFTLIEILVVIVIVGILSSFILIGTSSFFESARDSQRKAEMTRLRNAIWSASNMGVNGYPTTPDQGSNSRATCCLGTGDTNCTNIESAIGGAIPKDPSFKTGSKEYCYFYKSDGTTFDLYTMLENGGVVSLSESTVSSVKTSDDCGEGWINTGLGFCVMQYEAKCPVGDDVGSDGCAYAVSRAEGTPWTNISQINAAAACKAIGAHLINNAEWMAIARDIESVGTNWTGGSVGSGVIKRGNTGTCTGCYDGGDPEAGTNALATLYLSNTKAIHHFSGNVWEWVDYTIGTGSAPSQQPQLPTSAWAALNSKDVTNWGSVLGYDNVGPKNNNYGTTSYGSGAIWYNNTDTAVRALSGWLLELCFQCRGVRFAFDEFALEHVHVHWFPLRSVAISTTLTL